MIQGYLLDDEYIHRPKSDGHLSDYASNLNDDIKNSIEDCVSC